MFLLQWRFGMNCNTKTKISQHREARMSIYRKTATLRLSYQKEVIKELGDAAAILLNYYIANGDANRELKDDAQVGKAIGWSARKTREVRSQLTRAGYVKFIRSKTTIGAEKVVLGFNIFGKELVQKYLDEGVLVDTVIDEKALGALTADSDN